MRRILGFLVVLTFVLGTTSIFAASSDWSGYFRTKYRSTNTTYTSDSWTTGYVDQTWKTEYITTKLELIPTFNVSENVAVKAALFAQGYWGQGRLYNFATGSFIAYDGGGYDNVGLSTFNLEDPMNSTLGDQSYIMGVGAYWATLSFLEGKALTIDIGKRYVAEWGTGLFLGGPFTADRLQIMYKMSSPVGMMIPFFIFENRNDKHLDRKVAGDFQQILFGVIAVNPGKMLAGLVINPNFTSRDYDLMSLGAYKTLKSHTWWAFDLYVDYKLAAGPAFVKPIFEVLFATGPLFLTAGTKYHADTLNLIFKIEVTMPKLVMFTPEFIFNKAPKKTAGDPAESKEAYWNLFASNAFNGTFYEIGKIIISQSAAGFVNLGNFALTNPGSGGTTEEEPSTYVIKLGLDALILNEFVKGLNFKLWYVLAKPMAKYKSTVVATSTTTENIDSDKRIWNEIDFILQYAVDGTTTIEAYYAAAYIGRNSKFVTSSALRGARVTEIGADVKIKF